MRIKRQAAIRYDRAPSEALKELFKENGFLESLVDGLIARQDFENIPFGVCFRETPSGGPNNKVSIYCGRTAVLEIEFLESKQELSVFAQSDTYRVQDAEQKLMKRWDIKTDKKEDFEKELSAYLASVKVEKRWWNAEGALQAVYADFRGKNWNPTRPYLIVDREAVLGYSDGNTKEDVQQLFVSVRDEVLRGIQKKGKALGWRKPKKEESNKIDLLGVSSDGSRLLLLEAKHWKAADLYYSPLQLLHYVLEWDTALKSSGGEKIVEDINKLISIKKEIGFLPADAPLLNPTPKIQPILVVNRDIEHWSSEIAERYNLVCKMINESRVKERFADFKKEVWT